MEEITPLKQRPAQSIRSTHNWRGMLAILLTVNALTSARAEAPQSVAASTSDPYRGLWIQDTTFLFVRPEFTWGRDPFLKRPGFALSEESEPNWSLSAVFFDGPESEAIINGARVRIGEEVSGRIVEEIGPNYVLLSKNDSVLELNLPMKDGGAGSIHIEEIDPSTKK